MPPPLDEHGLSPSARRTLPADVADRVARRWAEGRALILNANRPDYSEAFTIAAEQYDAVRTAVLDAVEALGDYEGVVRLQAVVEFVQARLGDDALFPNGRMTNYTPLRQDRPRGPGRGRTAVGESAAHPEPGCVRSRPVDDGATKEQPC